MKQPRSQFIDFIEKRITVKRVFLNFSALGGAFYTQVKLLCPALTQALLAKGYLHTCSFSLKQIVETEPGIV